jgi:hypothetical protein
MWMGKACGKTFMVRLLCGTNAKEWGEYGAAGNNKWFKIKIGDGCPGVDMDTGYVNGICVKNKTDKNKYGASMHFDLERSSLPKDFPRFNDGVYKNLKPTGEGILEVRPGDYKPPS